MVSKINIFIDGASRGNPGKAGIGVAVYKDSKLVDKFSDYVGKKTNNEAEYLAFLRALEYLSKENISIANIFSDSEFLVKQITGKYRVKSLKIKPLFDKAKKIILDKDLNLNINWISRCDNEVADSLANCGIDDVDKKKVESKIDENKNILLKKSGIGENKQNLVLNKAFFGKINCLKIQMSDLGEVYFHMGIKDGAFKDGWVWQKVKMNEVEIGQIILILRKGDGKCSFFHSFDDKKTQIWCNMSLSGFSIKIGKVSKNLSIGEAEVLRIILENSIVKKYFFY